MALTQPLTYFRKRRDLAQFRKPTAHEKIAVLPYINPQQSSPLFSQIPGEIRHIIYEYALLGYPDLTRPYSKHTYYYRPGYTHPRAINTKLLRTCRRLYLEAGQLAIAQNEHLIYRPADHGPPGNHPYLLQGAKPAKGTNGRQRRGFLRDTQRKAVNCVHIFAQQCWLEGWNMNWSAYCASWSQLPSLLPSNEENEICRRCDHPPNLKITIRHTDWWYYLLGRNSPLALDAKKAGRALPGVWVPEEAGFEDGSWGSQFRHVTGLKVFELELETIIEKREELKQVVEKAGGWRFALGDGNLLVCDKDATNEMEWAGSKHIRGLPPSENVSRLGSRFERDATSGSRLGSRSNSSHKLTYSEEEDLLSEDTLNYVVVTLTWRAQCGTQPSEQDKSKTYDCRLEMDSEGDAENDDAGAGTNPPAIPPVGQATGGVPNGAPQGIFALNVARAPTRHAIPTYYG